MNPLACRQQLSGAAITGIGQALFEEIAYDNGQLINPNLVDYVLPSLGDMPPVIDSISIEIPDRNGPFGAKGIGESSLIPVAPAIANAVFERSACASGTFRSRRRKSISPLPSPTGLESLMRSCIDKSIFLAPMLFTVISCNSEILDKQALQIKEQQEELARQRREIDDLMANQVSHDQKQRDCNRAFRDYFEKAQSANQNETAISLYRDGLALCPDDEIAHYELGKALADSGRTAEAEKEFEAALKTNPNFLDAKTRLEALRKRSLTSGVG